MDLQENIGSVRGFTQYLAQFVNCHQCVFCFQPIRLKNRNIVSPQDLMGNDPDVLEVLEAHHHCFSYVAYIHQAQIMGQDKSSILSFEDALKYAEIDFMVLRINKRGVPTRICPELAEQSNNVCNLKKKRKRMIDDLFQDNKRSRLEMLQSVSESFRDNNDEMETL